MKKEKKKTEQMTQTPQAMQPAPTVPTPATNKLTVEEFVLRAIEKLADPGRRTIHTVYSGFNHAFRSYFPDLDPIEEVKKLTQEQKVSFRFCKGGALIGKPGTLQGTTDPTVALEKMGITQ